MNNNSNLQMADFMSSDDNATETSSILDDGD